MMKTILVSVLVTYALGAPNNSETAGLREDSVTTGRKTLHPFDSIKKLHSQSKELKPLHQTHSKNLNKKIGKNLLGVDGLLGRSIPSLLSALPKTKMDFSVGCGNKCKDLVDISSSLVENDVMDESLTRKQLDKKGSLEVLDPKLSEDSKSVPTNILRSLSDLDLTGPLGGDIKSQHAVPDFASWEDNDSSGSDTAVENTKNTEFLDNETNDGGPSVERSSITEDYVNSESKSNEKSVLSLQEDNEINETEIDVISYSRNTNQLSVTEDESMVSSRSTVAEINSNTQAHSQYGLAGESSAKSYEQTPLRGVWPFMHRYDPYDLSLTKMQSRIPIKKTRPSPSFKLRQVPLYNPFPQSVAGSDLYGSYAYANTGQFPNRGIGGTLGGGETGEVVIEETVQEISESQER